MYSHGEARACRANGDRRIDSDGGGGGIAQAISDFDGIGLSTRGRRKGSSARIDRAVPEVTE